MLNAERFKEEINKHNNEFGLTDSIADCKTLECRNCRFSRLNNSDDEIILCSTRKVKWLLSEYKEPIKLSKLEYDILKYLSDNTVHMYIVRDGNGNICLYDAEPKKSGNGDWWVGRGVHGMVMFDKLFQFIKWEDSTPTLIKDVLENCEVVNDAEE
jgi:hypothetical protein